MQPVSEFLAGIRPPISKLVDAFQRPLDSASALTGTIKSWLPRLENRPAQVPQQRSNRAAAADMDWLKGLSGTGAGWARSEYAEYYATSVSVYAAVRLRAEALSRPPLLVYSRNAAGNLQLVGSGHPLQQLMNQVNPWYTRGDLWRATEIYLSLWGSAYWALEKNEAGRWETWPRRPDRVSVIPDKNQYIRGFVYMGASGPVAYTSEEIVWLRYFNPLDEFAGLSPIAPARMAVDMGKDALRFNRNFLRNSAQPDFVLLTNESMTDNEVEDFYNRWEARYRGSTNAHRPAIASFVRDIKTLGISHKDMDFIQGLRWSLEEVSRTYGVPKPLLSDMERATFSNINAAERIFWRNTILSEMRFIEEQLNRMLLPRLGYGDLVVEFDSSSVEALREDENSRVTRESQLLDRGVLTINEVRRSRNLPDVSWGDSWAKAPNASKTQNRPRSLDNHGSEFSGSEFNGLGFDGPDASSNNGAAGFHIVGGS